MHSNFPVIGLHATNNCNNHDLGLCGISTNTLDAYGVLLFFVGQYQPTRM
jgi:hypothetical protein